MSLTHTDLLIGLVGQPNSGKSTIFRLLTHLQQDVGNYPGVTVDAKSGHYHEADRRIEVVDLPGTYSLSTLSEEDRVVRHFIQLERPEVLLVVADASNIRRHLFLIQQLLEMQIPIIVCLNFMDVAKRRGFVIDVLALENFLKVPVIPMIATKGDGLSELRKKILKIADANTQHLPTDWKIDYGSEVESVLTRIQTEIEKHSHLTEDFSSRWLAVKLAEGDRDARRIAQHHTHDNSWWSILDLAAEEAEKYEVKQKKSLRKDIFETRSLQTEMIDAVVTRPVNPKERRPHVSDRLDRYACHPFWGMIVLLVCMILTFQLTFNIADGWQWIPAFIGRLFGDLSGEATTPVNLLSTIFHVWLPGLLDSWIGWQASPIRSLINDGVLTGIGGVVQFVPVVFVMFSILAMLEQSGYIARVAMVMDSFMRRFGLQGQSILPMILGGGIIGGCAVPAILSARNMNDKRERLLTILVIPMLNCGGKIPVYAMLIAAFFSAWQGWIMTGIVLVSWSVALLSAFFLGKTLVKGEQSPLLLELPPYQIPRLKDVWSSASRQSGEFLKKAGTVILGANVLLWFLMTYPLPETQNSVGQNQNLNTNTSQRDIAHKNTAQIDINQIENISSDVNQSEDERTKNELTGTEQAKNELSGTELSQNISEGVTEKTLINAAEQPTFVRNPENSYAAQIGRILEPISRFAGFDWKDNVALIGGTAAKEFIVSSLITLHRSDSEQQNGSTQNNLAQNGSTQNNLAQNGSGTDNPEVISDQKNAGTENFNLSETLIQAPDWSAQKALAMILFVMLYAPCSGSLVAIARSTGSWSWSLIAFLFNTGLAFLLAVVVFQLGTFFWGAN